MSVMARKSGDRIARLRERSVNDIAVWDDSMQVGPNAVFLATDDVMGLLDRIDTCVMQAGLAKVRHEFVDGGVLVVFRRKRDADRFRLLSG